MTASAQFPAMQPPEAGTPRTPLARVRVLKQTYRRERWVLKAPAHMASLAGLLRAYPDARVVFTHRDPVASVASTAGLNAAMWRLVSPHGDRRAIGAQAVATLVRMHAVAHAVRARWPESAPPFLDLDYATLAREPLAICAVTAATAPNTIPTPYSPAGGSAMPSRVSPNERKTARTPAASTARASRVAFASVIDFSTMRHGDWSPLLDARVHWREVN